MKEIPYTIELINFLWKYNITENQFLFGVFVCFIFLMVMFFLLGRVTKASEIEIIEQVKIKETPVEKIVYVEKDETLSEQYHKNMIELDNKNLRAELDNLKEDYKKLNKSYDNMSYDELLKTSEWNVFRNVVLKTKGRICENCGKTDGKLNIHHRHYYTCKNGILFKPWEYAVNDVAVLCEECHKLWHTKYTAPVIKWTMRYFV